MFLSKIVRSVDLYPLACRFICHQLLSKVSRSYPAQVAPVVGSFFFIRFICPAIIKPEEYGVWDIEKVSVPPFARRALILISKTLRNLALNAEFGMKEEYLQLLNPFISDHQNTLKAFFQKLATPPISNDNVRELVSSIEPDPTHAQTLQNHVIKHSAAVRQFIIDGGFPASLDYDPLKALETVLAELN
jgi:GTPase-activator protein for Ras-like GTPase